MYQNSGHIYLFCSESGHIFWPFCQEFFSINHYFLNKKSPKVAWILALRLKLTTLGSVTVNYLYTSLCTFFICSIVFRRNLHSLSEQSARRDFAIKKYSSLIVFWISPRRQSTVVSSAFAIFIITDLLDLNKKEIDSILKFCKQKKMKLVSVYAPNIGLAPMK